MRRFTGLREADALDAGFEPTVIARHVDLIGTQPRCLLSGVKQLPPIVAHEIKAERIPIRHQIMDIVETVKLNTGLVQLQRDLVHVRPYG